MISKIKKIIPKPIKIFKRKVVWHYNNVRPPIYGNKDKDLFLGPWLGDVGSELFQWIPYVRRLKENGRLHHKNVYAISRGGVENWYGGLADNYVEILDYIDDKIYQEPFLRGKKRSLGEKVPALNKFGNETLNQFRISIIEKNLIAKYAEQHNIKNYEIFHPSHMWINVNKFKAHWQNDSLSLYEFDKSFLYEKFRMVTKKYSDLVDELDLPEDFIAAKFYYHPTNLLESKENAKHVSDYIRKLSKKKKIVDLSVPLPVDEVKSHLLDYENPNIFQVPLISQKSINLGVQTEIIRRSQGLVGTYGGMSLLPAFLGKPHLGFFSGHVKSIDQNMGTLHPYPHETMTFAHIYEELNQLPCKTTDIKRVNVLGNLFAGSSVT